MIERTEERFGLKPERLVGDTAYGAAPMLNWLVEEKGIAPHIPVFDKSKRDDGTFSRSDFRCGRPMTPVIPLPGRKVAQDERLQCTKAERFCIVQSKLDLRCMSLSNRNAAQRNRRARSRATSMSTPGTVARSSFAGTEELAEQSQRAAQEDRDAVRTLESASLGLGRLRLHVAHEAPRMSLSSGLPSPRTCGDSALLVARPPPVQALCTA